MESWLPLTAALGLVGFKLARGKAISKMMYAAVGAVVALTYFSRPHTFHTHEPGADHAILVTGASRGIGKHAALTLVDKGYFVFAGVRSEADGEALRANASNPALLQPVLLDVTRADQIAAAVQTVEQSGKKLVGLVNNAGKVAYGPMELAESAMEDTMNVNYFSVVRLTNAMLPLLRAARGRLLFVSSLAGKVSGLSNGMYCATKFALEAAGEAYRQELHGQDIAVSIVEPGFVDTDMPRGVAKALGTWRTSFPHASETQLNAYDRAMTAYGKTMTQALEVSFGEVTDTTVAIVHALESPQPLPRYLVGYDAHIIGFLRWLMPDALYDRFSRVSIGA